MKKSLKPSTDLYNRWTRKDVIESCREWRKMTIENTDPIDEDRLFTALKKYYSFIQRHNLSKRQIRIVPSLRVAVNDIFDYPAYKRAKKPWVDYTYWDILRAVSDSGHIHLRETVAAELPNEMYHRDLGDWGPGWFGVYHRFPEDFTAITSLQVTAVLWHAYKVGDLLHEQHRLWLEVVKELNWAVLAYDMGDVIIGDRPQFISHDLNWQIHNPDGPAIVYRDGHERFFIHGTRVKPWMIQRKDKIRPKHIFKIGWPFDVRIWMVEQYGWERFLRDVHAEHVASDIVGRMWRVANFMHGRDPLHVVEVLNGTEEVDGTYKKYFLRVPDSCRTPLAGIAWTYGLEPLQYLNLKLRT